MKKEEAVYINQETFNIHMEERLNDMEDKIDVLVENQENFRKEQAEFKEKFNKLYDALVGNELTENKGLIHSISEFKIEVKNQNDALSGRVSANEKFIDKLKNYYVIAMFVCTAIGFSLELLWQYFVNVMKNKK